MTEAGPKAPEADVDVAIAAVEEQMSVLFTRVRSLMRSRVSQVHPELQPAGYTVLSSLVRLGPIHGGRLADLLAMDKSAVSRQVAALEGLGLVERQADPSDGRAYFLVPSASAEERIAQMRESAQAVLYEHLRDWADGDVARLGELLGRLNEIPV